MDAASTQQLSKQRQAYKRRIFWTIESILLIGIVYGTAVFSRWLSSNTVEFSPIWPPTGIAVAVALLRPSQLISIAVGLFCWAFYSINASWDWSLLICLTLAGPLLVRAVKVRWGFRQLSYQSGNIKQLKFNFIAIFLIGIIPSSLIGSYLFYIQAIDTAFVDILIVYLISDAAGIMLLSPIFYGLLKKPTLKLTGVSFRYIWFSCVTLFFVMIPPFFEYLDYSKYAQSSYLLILPYLAWVATRNNLHKLAWGVFIVGLAHLSFVSIGIGFELSNLTPNTLIQETLLILVAGIFGYFLLANSLERLQHFEQAKWQALHNEHTQWLNERGLQKQLEHLPKDQQHDILLTQVCRRDLLLSSLSYEELKAIELHLCQTLHERHTWIATARLSDLTLGFIVPSKSELALDQHDFQTINIQGLGIALSLAWARVPIKERPERSLTDAYSALQLAKEQPMTRVFEISRSEHQTKTSSFFSLYQDIIESIHHEGIVLYGQKILGTKDSQLTIEVLSRLKNKEGKILMPGEFLPILRAFDDLERLDRQVILTFIQYAHHFKAHWPKIEKININLSGSTLCDPEFEGWLMKHWQEAIPKEKICFEITESELIRNWDLAVSIAKQLKTLGFKVAIDDFGSGLASYEYIERFQVDLIKLDGQFIQELANNPIHQAMVKATVNIARSMDLKVCAEFVDSENTLQLLQAEGVDYFQGYYIGKPAPLDHFWEALPTQSNLQSDGSDPQNSSYRYKS